MYIVSLICKANFKNLDSLILNRDAIGKIFKIMIFVDKINNTIMMAKYLQSKLFEQIQNEKDPENVICIFSANLTITSRSKFLASL